MSQHDDLYKFLLLRDKTGKAIWSRVMEDDHISLDDVSIELIRYVLEATDIPFRHIMGFLILAARLERRHLDGRFCVEIIERVLDADWVDG